MSGYQDVSSEGDEEPPIYIPPYSQAPLGERNFRVSSIVICNGEITGSAEINESSGIGSSVVLTPNQAMNMNRGFQRVNFKDNDSSEYSVGEKVNNKEGVKNSFYSK
jgi:hypothetical protein